MTHAGTWSDPEPLPEGGWWVTSPVTVRPVLADGTALVLPAGDRVRVSDAEREALLALGLAAEWERVG